MRRSVHLQAAMAVIRFTGFNCLLHRVLMQQSNAAAMFQVNYQPAAGFQTLRVCAGAASKHTA